jgi:hypothetical protein
VRKNNASNLAILVVALLLLPFIAYARYRYEVWFVRHVVEAIEE